MSFVQKKSLSSEKNSDFKFPIKEPDYSSYVSCTSQNYYDECTVCQKAKDVSQFNFSTNFVDKTKEQFGKQFKCIHCFSLVKYGSKHACKTSYAVDNVSSHVSKNFTQKQKEHLVCTLVKDLRMEKNTAKDANSGHFLTLSQKRGKPMKFLDNSYQSQQKKAKVTQISAEDVLKIASQFRLSTK